MKEQENKAILSMDTEIDLENIGDKIAGGDDIASAGDEPFPTLPDLNAQSIESALRMIGGTARSMGITIEERTE